MEAGYIENEKKKEDITRGTKGIVEQDCGTRRRRKNS